MNGEGKIIWINYETKKIDYSIVLSGSEVGHMEGMTYDSNNKWVIVGVSGSRVLAINNLNKSKIYVKVPKHFSHYAYSVSTHELLGYRNRKITFMKYDASKNQYIEQRTITLSGANITHIQGISCDGQVIFLSDSRPQSKMNSDKYRVWAFDYQGNKVEEHSIGTGWTRGTKEIENCIVDKNGNLIMFFPHMIAIAQGYKANPVDWENSTAANSTTSTTSTTGSNTQVEEILKYACSWIGKIRYKLGSGQKLVNGGSSDCSHFVHRVYEHYGLMDKFVHSLDWGKGGDNGGCPGTINIGTDMSKASPGDVIWEHYGSGSHNHVYIYLGKDKNGKYKKVQCANTNHAQGVYISNVNTKEVDAILHFKVLPTDTDAYFDPDTGILHSSNGSTSTSNNSDYSKSGQAIVDEAEKYVGKLPYVWGGSSLETGADCSGFCWAILHKLGLYSGGRITTFGFETAGKEVSSLSEAQAGDMIVYGPGKGRSYHMAIYDGHGGIIHEADEQEDCKHGSNAAFAKILTIRRFAESSGSSTTESSNDTSTGNKAVFKVKVATWQENTEKVVSTDESENKNDHNYNMSEITIPYQSIVAQYRMPFNYLWAMLIYSNDKSYTFDLADLVRNSQIEITIHDNYNKTKTVTKEERTTDYKYTGQANVKFDYTYNIQYPNNTSTKVKGSNTLQDIIKGTATEKEYYEKTTTIVNKTNTLDIALTLADSWCVKYEKKYKYNEQPNTHDTSTQTDKIQDSDTYSEITSSKLKNNILSKANAKAFEWINSRGTGESVSTSIIHNDNEQQETEYTTNTKTTSTIDTTSSSYTAEPDKEKFYTDEMPKFATVFNKHYNARSNILSAKDWFFEALESNADTANMVDLTKYLIYKSTGTAIDRIKTYNFSVYNPSDFTNIGGTLEGNTTEERVWLALINAGFNDVAAAGAMGNLSYESGGSSTKTIKTDVVEGGFTENNGGIGMCQWTNNNRGSEGRNTQLRKYAQSKGKTWKDEATQIEFLITEITGQGKAKGYASYQFMTKTYNGVTYQSDAVKNVENDQSKIDYATRAFAATFERPSEGAFMSSMLKRIELATYFYNQFKGKRSTSLPTGNLPFNLEHAINVFDGIHARENGNLKWQGEIVHHRGGTLGCYEEAVNIFNGTNYRIYEIYDVLVKAHPELKHSGKEPYKCEDVNYKFNMKVSRAKANITNVKDALKQGKLVQLMVNTNKWRNSRGEWVSWKGTHSGLIFYFDGVHYHMKAAGKINQKNALYTEQQLIEWIGNVGNRLVIYTKIK
ncbi:MAG: C40 family peptidase [Clostridia bacterium]|nr:C40 family peptidase [Clostridia bacterium]